jgi:hypothetical protein
VNLAVALPCGYALLARGWAIAGRFQRLFVTLGQGWLVAFVLLVYGLLVVAHLPSNRRIVDQYCRADSTYRCDCLFAERPSAMARRTGQRFHAADVTPAPAG